MYLVIIGFSLAFLAIILRAVILQTRKTKLDLKYYAFLSLSVIGSVIAGFGFSQLAQTEVNENFDYSQILTVISLLAAGIITGNFTFTYEEMAEDEIFITTLISICFTFLFYFVFAAISFYMGKSKQIHSVEGAVLIGPIIMWALLLANALYDFWDFRKSA